MSNRFSKLLSVILSLAMLISMCGVTTFADEPAVASETVPTYYVMYGGTGDGTSADSPAGNLATVLSAINANTACDEVGEEAIVYIVRNEEAEATHANPLTSDGTVPYVTWYSSNSANSPTHAATITYKSYDSTKSRIRFNGGFQSKSPYGDNIAIGGPTVFDGVDLIVGRIAGGDRLIGSNEYSVEFKNSTVLAAYSASYATSGAELTVYPYVDSQSGETMIRKDHFLTLTTTNGVQNSPKADQKLEDYDTELVVDNVGNLHVGAIYIVGNVSGADMDVTVSGNATMRLGGGALPNFRFSHNSAVGPVIKGNLNIILDATQIEKITSTTTTLAVGGAFQVLKNNGAKFNVTADMVDTDAAYILTPETGITMDITDTVGTYSVDGATVAYAVGDNVVYYGTDSLTVAPGTYAVKNADSVEAIISTLDAVTPPEGYIYNGWSDNGDGTITPKFSVRPTLTGEYFVQWNQKEGRDGSEEKPFKDVIEAVKAINALGIYEKGDIVTLKIRNDSTDVKTLSGYADGGAYKDHFWAYDAAGNYIQGGEVATFFGTGNNGTVESRMTSWGNTAYTIYPEAHVYNLVIEGTGTGANDAYLAQSPYIGKNTHAVANGPTSFKNIKLVTNRNCDREWGLNGYASTFENVKFVHFNAAQYGGKYEGMSDVNTAITQKGYATLELDRAPYYGMERTTNTGGLFKFINTSFGMTETSDMKQYGLFISKEAITFSEPTTIWLENCDSDKYINLQWGAGYGSAKEEVFEQGLTVIVDNTEIRNVTNYGLAVGHANLGSAIVKGDLVFIAVNGGQIVNDIPGNVTVTGSVYNVSVDGDVMLAPTETSGVLDITEGYIYTVSEDGKTISYNNDTVTAKAGESVSLLGAASVADIMTKVSLPAAPAGKINGKWVDDGNGTITATYDDKTITPVYVKYGGGTYTTATGTKESPFRSVNQAVTYLNSLNYYVAGEEVPVIILEDTIPAEKQVLASGGDTDDTSDDVYHTEYWKYDSNYNFIYNKSKNTFVDESGNPVVSRFTPWCVEGQDGRTFRKGDVPAHAYTIVVQGEGTNIPYLSQNQSIGDNTQFTLGGPTKFKNVKLMINRNCDREVVTLNHEAWFDTVTFVQSNASKYDNKDANGAYIGGGWYGPSDVQNNVKGHTMIVFTHPDEAGVKGSTPKMHFTNCTFTDGDDATYGIRFDRAAAMNFESTVVIDIKDSDPVSINFSVPNHNTNDVTFSKGLDINLDDTTVYFNGTSVNYVVKEGLLITLKNGASTDALPSNVIYDKLYKFTITSDNTITRTETVGTFMTDAAGKYYVALDANDNAAFGKVNADGTVVLPEGEWTVTFSDTDFTADNFAAMRASVAATKGNHYATRLSWTDDDADGIYECKLEKFKVTLNKPDLNRLEYATLGMGENKGSKVYTAEHTTKFGYPVTKISRTDVPAVLGTDYTQSYSTYIHPNLAYDNRESMNSENIYMSDVRYITIWYYYESPLATPTHAGNVAKWTIGQAYDTVNDATDTTWPVVSELPSNNTIEANKWTAVVFDLAKSSGWSKYQSFANKDYALVQQRVYPMGIANATLLDKSETFYMGPIEFTNYDPTEEIANNPAIVFVSETGDDANSGLSDVQAVKTIGRAYEILKNAENDSCMLISGTVEAGTVANTNENITVTVNAADANAKISSFVTGSDVVFEDITVDALTVDGGRHVQIKSGNVASLGIVDGYVEALGGTIASATVASEQGAVAGLAVDGATVSAINIASEGGLVTLGYVSGEMGDITVADGAYADDLQILLGYGEDVPAAFEDLTVTGKKIVVNPPVMKTATGIPFSVKPTREFGVFETYSGSSYNFGYGKTTYICWGVNEAGTKAYYSNSATDFVLTIPEAGTYRLDIAAERDYTAANGKEIKGFNVNTHLVLPEGYIGWINDNNGTISATTAEAATITQYVSNKLGNDDDNDGLTQNAPVKTIAQALFNIGSVANGHVIIMDTLDESTFYTRDNSNPYQYYGEQDILIYSSGAGSYPMAHSGTVTYEGLTQDSVLIYGPHGLYMGGPSVFKNLTLIEGYNASKSIATNGYDLRFENVTYYNVYGPHDNGSDEWKKVNPVLGPTSLRGITTGYTTDTGADGRIVITDFISGTGNDVGDLNIGASNGNVTLGNQTVVIDGGKVAQIKMFSDTKSFENISIILNSGTVGSITDRGYATSVNAIQIINNNGLTLPALPAFAKATVNGTWIMNSGENAGGTLDVTDEAGVFEVLGGKIARAENAGGAVYYSLNSLLTVPTGTWTVTYVDTAPVTFDGTVITAVETAELDLVNYTAVAPANKTFIGWADEEGNFFETSKITLEEGETATAKFVDFNTALMGDASVLGVQIRIANEHVSQGLRFVTQLNKSLLANLGITDIGGANVKYGTVVLPADLQGTAPLTLETEARAKVLAKNTYAQNENIVRYTAVLTDISEANFDRIYNARPYIEYTDKNGVERVIYGETYGTSLYKAARYALQTDGSLSETAKAALENIKTTSVAIIDEPVTLLTEYGKITARADAMPTSFETITDENYKRGEVFYKTASGVVVREIHITGGTGTEAAPAQEAVLGIITDTHVNLINEKDDYDPELQYTWQTRPGWRGESNLRAIKASADFASMYDQMIVTGDIIDYLSYGALDFVKETMLDPYPNGLYVMGGHDITKQMETGFSDETSEQDRFEMLYEYYGQPTDDNKHNIHYSTRLVNNNVLCINLNNGTNFQYKYDTDWLTIDMANKLQASIDEARENGWIVLIFQHEPTSTYDTSVGSINAYDGSITNATGTKEKVSYEGRDYCYVDNNGNPRVHQSFNDTPTSLAVYNIIRSSADVVKGLFTGHHHTANYMEVLAINENGETYKPDEATIAAEGLIVNDEGYAVIPQFINRPPTYDAGDPGHVTKVIVTAAE